MDNNQIKKNKKRVVSTLFLYLFLFIVACDFKPPDKWETPSWYIDLTIPLINTEYSFDGFVNDSIIFADSISDVIQIEFGDTLPANGIPNSIFRINMGAADMDMPNLDIGGSDPITLPSIPSEALNIPIPIDIDLSTLECFPVNMLDTFTEIPEENGSISLDFDIDNSVVEVKKVVIVDGIWNMTITNNLPLTITSVDFTIRNGSSILYSTTLLTKIDPYTTKSDPQDITGINPTEIDITDDMLYSVLITIDTDQSGEDGVSCPDIDNLPVYICDENILGGLYSNDDTCDDNCDISDCTLIFYCDGNMVDAYPNENLCSEICNGNCSQGGYVGGWEIDQDITPSIDLSFIYSFDEIDSVIVDFMGIDTTMFTKMPIPGYSGITIKRAKIDSPNDDFPNQIVLDISNNLFAEFILDFDFINFFNEDTGEKLSESIIIDAYNSKETVINFSEYILASGLHNGQYSEDAIDTLIISIGARIEPDEYAINVVENQISIGSPVFNTIEMSNMSLEYIEAITDSLEFDGIDSPPIEGIPDGFSDFEFYDIIMEIEFFNEIGIPVELNMELTGTKEGVEEEKLVPINTVIGSPSETLYGCDFSKIGDTARTVIQIDKDSLITEYYCNTTDTSPSEISRKTFDSDQSSIVELMNFAPEMISVGGGVTIDGTGILAPGTEVWGAFTLITPLAFVFKKPINIIPSESTPMNPMDPATSENIISSLIEAALHVIITNRSPVGGNLSLLISDSTIFPLFLDSLITGTWEENLSYQEKQFGYMFHHNQITQQPWIWDSLGIQIDSISFTPVDESSDPPKALEVNFFRNDSLQFFIGRMFDLSFPASDSIDYQTGYVDPNFPEIYTSNVVIDTTRMGWVITDQSRNSIAMITFDGSPIENDTTFIPLTLQETNSIGVQAFLTLQLDTGGMNREKSKP